MPAFKMKESLKKYCLSLLPFTNEELDIFATYFSVVEIPKKAFFVSAGKICKEIAFIHNGLIRHFHVKDGVEITCDISTENTFITEYSSFKKEIPSKVSFQALEPTQLFVIRKEKLTELYQKHPQFEELGRLIAENTAIRNNDIAMSLASDKPETRYKKLMAENPAIFNRVQQKYIANYLGITPESLSRIKKRVFVQSKS